MSQNKDTAPKTLAEELQRLPIDYQRRIKWTLRISAAWLSLVLGGAGIFILSKPYMDRRRKEKLESGEFFKEIRESEAKYGITRSYGKTDLYKQYDNSKLEPPVHLVGIIDQVAKEEFLKTKDSS